MTTLISSQKSQKTNAKLKTRRAIFEYIKLNGPQTAPNLALHINVTPMAIRLHLYDLADENLVQFQERKQSRGRPAKYWNLTQNAQSIFPDSHQALAVDLLATIKQALGQSGLDKIVDSHSQSQLKGYMAKLKAEKSLSARLKLLVKIRSDEGYMASMHRDGQGWIFCENHCPICAAATACTKLCANELWVFQQLIGKDYTIKREDHIIQGARRCQYRIQKTVR